jgi:hypothetical protein
LAAQPLLFWSSDTQIEERRRIEATLMHTEAREQTSDDADREQGSAVLVVLGALTCAAVFVIAYGGWV